MSNNIETVTLTRAEYEALIERAEEAEDLAAIAAAEAREAALGKKTARALIISRSNWCGGATRESIRSEFGGFIAA